MDLYERPPSGAVVVCADEPGPMLPRAFPPVSGWSPDGRRTRGAGTRKPTLTGS